MKFQKRRKLYWIGGSGIRENGDVKKGDVIQLVCDEADGKELLASEDYGVGKELNVYYSGVLSLDYQVWIVSVEEQIEKLD